MKNKIKYIIAFTTILLLLVMSFPLILNADTEAEIYYENAMKLFYEKDFCEAEIELRKALTLDPYYQEAIDALSSRESIRELEEGQLIEEIVIKEISTSNDVIISAANNKIKIYIPAGALTGIEENNQVIIVTAKNNADREEIENEFLKSGIVVRTDGEHAVFKEIDEGTKNPIKEYVLGSNLYIFNLEEKNGMEDFKFYQDIEVTLEFDWDLINPTLAYWDENSREWVSKDSVIIDCNHLTANFDDLEDKKLCVLGDISTQVKEEITPEIGGLLEYRSNNIKRAELIVPKGAVDNNIVMSVAEVYKKDFIEEISMLEGYRIDGKIYDLRSQDTTNLIDYGTFTSPFLKPIVLTLECSKDAICPKIAYFVCTECYQGWEIVPTKRISNTYVRAYIYHLSKWAVLDNIPEGRAEGRIDDEEITETMIEEEADGKITENWFILFFKNIWDFIKSIFVNVFD